MNISLQKDRLYILTYNPQETQSLGGVIGQVIQPGIIIGLVGELGSGKTCLVKGIASGLGIDPQLITSPSFVLLNSYQGRLTMNHFDFYRLGQDDILRLELYEFIKNAFAVIEWVENIPISPSLPIFLIKFTIEDQNTRQLTLTGNCEEIVKIIEDIHNMLISRKLIVNSFHRGV
jgi:tRNA threonylcarbamoyladenosine biosynthesis protein TsaE